MATLGFALLHKLCHRKRTHDGDGPYETRTLYTTPPAQPAPVQKKSQQFTSEMNYSNNFKQGERNFCPRCGKRAGDYIHTCTPPQ